MRMKTSDTTVMLVMALLWAGCGAREEADLKTAATPAEAASQIERAFAGAPEETRHAASVAAEALRRGEYEKAVVSLTTVRSATNVTLDQGMAVHNSTLQLEARLAAEIAAGNEAATRAYGLLKAMKAK
jgi:hypothetical protein